MKCPYVFGVQTEIHTRFSNANEETGVFNKEQSTTVTSGKMPECIEKECAAWENGRCYFNGKLIEVKRYESVV